MQKVIVTGGAGFIGSHLVERLIAESYDVHIIDNLSTGKRENVNPKATLHVADTRHLDDIKKIFEGAVAVFHMAALPSVQYSIEHPLETNEINVLGMQNVLISAAEAKVGRLVYSASCAAYGDQKQMPFTEDMPPMPLSPYGMHKYVGEVYARVWSEVYKLETVSLRYFNVYGPRAKSDGAYASVIARFIALRAEGKPLTITGDGEQTRDYVHVSDVVEANMRAMKSDKVGRGEVINVGYGKEISVNAIADIVGGEKQYVPERLEPKRVLADITKAKALLDWQPKVAPEEGISIMAKPTA
ncbi:NAD-dependent epimerase/dehydratase family protein [Candidatus Parcubacteria bacterium]|nr:NAD-dependent epimerase/dehydratase family protein [Candidatus Parcubacteria bacterium]